MKKKMFFLSLIAFTFFASMSNVYADETYNNYDKYTSSTVSCGGIEGIPSILPKTVSIIYTLILIAIPVILIILGMIDMMKSMTAGKEDEIAKARGMFFKRLISAALVFFILVVVKLLMSVLTKDSETIMKCVDCFINDNCYINKNENGYCELNGHKFTINSNGTIAVKIPAGSPVIYVPSTNEFRPEFEGECPNPNSYKVVTEKTEDNGPNHDSYYFKIVKK